MQNRGRIQGGPIVFKRGGYFCLNLVWYLPRWLSVVLAERAACRHCLAATPPCPVKPLRGLRPRLRGPRPRPPPPATRRDWRPSTGRRTGGGPFLGSTYSTYSPLGKASLWNKMLHSKKIMISTTFD